MAESKTAPKGAPRGTYTLEMVGLEPGAARPPVVVQAVDAKGGILHAEKVSDTGGFSLPADALKNARYVTIGAPAGDNGVDAGAAVRFRRSEFELASATGTLALAEGIWSRFRIFWTCVSGSVRVCRRRPRWFDDIFTTVSDAVREPAFRRLSASRGAASIATGLRPSLNDIIAWPTRCWPVCLGTVDVYRRTCCCWPLLIDDRRIPDLVRDLERIVDRLPKLPQPKFPVPPPPPPPINPFSTPLFRGGALNEMALNAPADLRALRSLGSEQAVQYINSRAYLLRHICSCSRPVKVASGSILDDGTFNVCWIERFRFLRAECHDEYAYVVTQTIGGVSTTIYDGLAAGAWYHAGDHPVLTTYRADAFSCSETGTGDGTAAIFLDLIGDTDSHELTTPDATGWDRVAAPNDTSGLLFPNPLDTRGHLRNLGGRLELTYSFPAALRDIGAMYYRVSISKADANGNPIGDRMYYGQGINSGNDGLTWHKRVGLDSVPVVLGPNPPVGAENYLYKIPYEDADEPWIGTVRYHALLDTRSLLLNVPDDSDAEFGTDATNHLVTLEVFDALGHRLRPLGTPPSGLPGVEDAKAFKYLRWFQPESSPGDDFKEVPFAALTHLVCWDNRQPRAEITALVSNSLESDEMCQFIQGPGNSTFAIAYRAFVPDERFQYGHSISWTRGLGGTVENGGKGSLPTPLSPTNVGEPPDAPQNSGTNTFTQMLTLIDPGPPEVETVLDRCAFSVTLTTHVKTTDGAYLGYDNAQATAAFALQITP
jgi:hypothetical protein